MSGSYLYNRPETGQTEQVAPERWRWKAIYQSGETLFQYNDEDDSFHQLREIDQSQLKEFRMYSPDHPLEYVVHFNPETDKLVHYYLRNVFNARTPHETKSTWYVFGVERKTGDKASKLFYKIDDKDRFYVGDGEGFAMIAFEGGQVIHAI